MPDTDMSDKQLAAMAAQGDAESYRRLFERYQSPVYNFVYRLVNNVEDASDIVQNAFLRMYTVLGDRDVENFSAYLYRTARNLAYDEMRRRSRFADVDTEAVVSEDPNIYADPSKALMLQEQIDSVRRAAGRLNDNQREALLLRELQEFDYQQMSEVLGSNRNAVGALLSRARLSFREELRMAQLKTDQIPTECEEIILLLSPYIDNELTEEEAIRVGAHLADCTFCTAALEEMREASRSFRMLIPIIPPADMAQAFTGRLADLTGHSFSEAVPSGSWMSRLIRSRALWISAAVVLVMASTTFILAEEINREGAIVEPSNEIETEPIQSVSPVGGMPAVEQVQDPETETDHEGIPVDGGETSTTVTSTEPGNTQTGTGTTNVSTTPPNQQSTTPGTNSPYPGISGRPPGANQTEPGINEVARGLIDRLRLVSPSAPE